MLICYIVAIACPVMGVGWYVAKVCAALDYERGELVPIIVSPDRLPRKDIRFGGGCGAVWNM